jgi:hypothetical protein
MKKRIAAIAGVAVLMAGAGMIAYGTGKRDASPAREPVTATPPAEAQPQQANAADTNTCVPLPVHVPRGGAFGMERWSDDKLIVTDNMRGRVKGPEYWVPVGSYRMTDPADRCVLFPDGQSTVFINPAHWRVDAYPVPSVGIYAVRFIPKMFSDAQVDEVDALIQRSYAKVRSLFPLGLSDFMLQDHHVLVTTGIAGDGSRRENRIFVFPGPHLSGIMGEIGSPHNEQFFIRQAVYLFNKMRPREETFKDDALLVGTAWSDMVGAWAAIALYDNPDVIRRQVDAHYANHAALTDDDEDTWPDPRQYRGIDTLRGPFGMPPHTPRRNAAIRYAVNDLAPLIMIALDGLLAREGKTETMTDFVRMMNTKKELTLPKTMQVVLSPEGYEVFLSWLKGGRIDRAYIDEGLAILQKAHQPQP